MKEYRSIQEAYMTSDKYANTVCFRGFEHLLDREVISFADSKGRNQTLEYPPIKLLICSPELTQSLKSNTICPVAMENEGAETNNNHDPSLTTGTGDDTTELIWNFQEYDMDALLGDDINAGADNDAEGRKDNHPESAASSKHKRHTIHQVQELETMFQSCTHPDDETRKALGVKIGMDSQQIKNWFQNRRSQKKVKSCLEQNDQIRAQNAVLRVENVELRKKVLERTCFPCLCLTAPPELLTEKQHLVLENGRLKEEYLHAEANLKELSRGAPLPLAVPSIGRDRVTLLLQRGERAMKEFMALNAANAPMWLPSSDNGEVLNDQVYTSAMFPRLLGPCPGGFVSEATRDSAIVWATAADLVAMLTDAGRWSEMFPGIVAAVSSRDVGKSTMPGSYHGMMQLMNAELWVQSPRVPNRSVEFLRFTQMTANGRQWAVVDVSLDAILANGQGGGVERLSDQRARSLLLPSGCLLEDMDDGCCKVTWIVHAEYDETAVPQPFRPLLRSGQALGAPRWVAMLMRQCEFMGVLRNFPTYDRRKRVMETARRMTASFYAAISGPIMLPGSNVREWRGSAGTGTEMFEADVRMMIWNCPSNASQQPDSYLQVLSATTTVWLPNTEPQVVLDYLRDDRRRGEWDILTGGSKVKELGSIITSNHHGNTISLLQPIVTDGTNNKMLILQEVCSDKSFSMVTYSLIEEKVMLAVAEGFLPPSGFAILPDAHRKTSQAPSAAASSSNAPTGHNNTTGCLLTAAYQTLWPNPRTQDLAATFDAMGKQLCCAIENIRAAVEASVIIPA